jgi:drug/metabolite transporter (DMT)-like permease
MVVTPTVASRIAPGLAEPLRLDSADSPRLQPSAAQRLVPAVLFMVGSLLLVLLVNALARELTARYPVGEVLFFRFLGASVLLAILFRGDAAGALRTPHLKLHLVRVALGVGSTLALYMALQHLPFADLMAIAYASPLVVAMLSWSALGERVGLRRVGFILAGFGGILIVAFPGRLEIWSIGALVMALLNAGALMTTRSLGRMENARTIAVCFAVFGTVATAPMLFFGCKLPDASDMLLFAALGGTAGLAIHLHAQAFRRAQAAVLAPIDYFAVVISPAFAWLFWTEVPSSWMLIGGAIIIAAGMLQLREAHREATRDVFSRPDVRAPSEGTLSKSG